MKFAGRVPIGTPHHRVLRKRAQWLTIENVEKPLLAIGLACSEIFSGRNLANVLRPAHDLEASALHLLQKNEPADTLSLHTSAGVNPALSTFMDAFQPHLPKSFETDDSCISLQVSGADAVWAATDLLLQLQTVRGHTLRTKVAVAARSYHGPGTSAFGHAAPLGAHAKTPLQCTYPAPSIFSRTKDDVNESIFHERIWNEYKYFLDYHSSDVGVLLVEPQWGSSCLAQPWNRSLLQRYIKAAQARGILVISDEIMCGLGRHGQNTTFCSDAWELDVDAVTFGKAIAAGVEPLAGAVIKRGADELGTAGKSVLQSHTYAGASTRALTTGAAVLTELSAGKWKKRASDVGERIIAPLFEDLRQASGGLLGVQGQGFMWGGCFTHHDSIEQHAAIDIFRGEAKKAHVLPYMVPESGGFMFTPCMDIPEEDLLEAGKRLAIAVERTAETLRTDRHWTVVDVDDPFMGCCQTSAPSSSSSTSMHSSTTSTSSNCTKGRYKGPQDDPAAMTLRQKEIYDAISKNRTTGVAGPFGPWLANPELAQHAQMLGKTCRYDLGSYDLRRSEMVILMTAVHTNAPTEWAIHVHEARKYGLEEQIIDAVQIHGCDIPDEILDAIFVGDGSEVDHAIYHFAAQLNQTNRVDDNAYWKLQRLLGDTACVELVGLVGYYDLVSKTLNTFEIEA